MIGVITYVVPHARFIMPRAEVRHVASHDDRIAVHLSGMPAPFDCITLDMTPEQRIEFVNDILGGAETDAMWKLESFADDVSSNEIRAARVTDIFRDRGGRLSYSHMAMTFRAHSGEVFEIKTKNNGRRDQLENDGGYVILNRWTREERR